MLYARKYGNLPKPKGKADIYFSVPAHLHWGKTGSGKDYTWNVIVSPTPKPFLWEKKQGPERDCFQPACQSMPSSKVAPYLPLLIKIDALSCSMLFLSKGFYILNPSIREKGKPICIFVGPLERKVTFSYCVHPLVSTFVSHEQV